MAKQVPACLLVDIGLELELVLERGLAQRRGTCTDAIEPALEVRKRVPGVLAQDEGFGELLALCACQWGTTSYGSPRFSKKSATFAGLGEGCAGELELGV